MKGKTQKCRWCGKGGKLKYYIIADDIEHPKPYHEKCLLELRMACIQMVFKAYSDKLKASK